MVYKPYQAELVLSQLLEFFCHQASTLIDLGMHRKSQNAYFVSFCWQLLLSFGLSCLFFGAIWIVIFCVISFAICLVILVVVFCHVCVCHFCHLGSCALKKQCLRGKIATKLTKWYKKWQENDNKHENCKNNDNNKINLKKTMTKKMKRSCQHTYLKQTQSMAARIFHFDPVICSSKLPTPWLPMSSRCSWAAISRSMSWRDKVCCLGAMAWSNGMVPWHAMASAMEFDSWR